MRAVFKSLAVKYTAIAILPLAVLLWQPAANFTVLTLGERVLLRTRPLDPRDFLRGDYVVLDYDIADIPKDLLPKDSLPSDDEDERAALLRLGWKQTGQFGGYGSEYYRDLYVTLELDADGVGSISDTSFTRPLGGLYLKATLVYPFWGSSFTADYGLGVYYVPEGTGREIENAVREGDVLADVRVFKGRAVLKSLEVPPPEDGR
jgi:uncharacterized membrane-anchored protein